MSTKRNTDRQYEWIIKSNNQKTIEFKSRHTIFFHNIQETKGIKTAVRVNN